MKERAKPIVILLADDDEEDREMALKALQRADVADEIFTVSDGEELLDFLNHRGAYGPPAVSPTPGLILLDLNMPKKDGREALAEIKADPALRRIPVVVMTTSHAERDILHTYNLGSNSYISKPVSMDELVDVMTALGHYWFQVVRLPSSAEVL